MKYRAGSVRHTSLVRSVIARIFLFWFLSLSLSSRPFTTTLSPYTSYDVNYRDLITMKKTRDRWQPDRGGTFALHRIDFTQLLNIHVSPLTLVTVLLHRSRPRIRHSLTSSRGWTWNVSFARNNHVLCRSSCIDENMTQPTRKIGRIEELIQPLAILSSLVYKYAEWRQGKTGILFVKKKKKTVECLLVESVTFR